MRGKLIVFLILVSQVNFALPDPTMPYFAGSRRYRAPLYENFPFPLYNLLDNPAIAGTKSLQNGGALFRFNHPGVFSYQAESMGVVDFGSFKERHKMGLALHTRQSQQNALIYKFAPVYAYSLTPTDKYGHRWENQLLIGIKPELKIQSIPETLVPSGLDPRKGVLWVSNDTGKVFFGDVSIGLWYKLAQPGLSFGYSFNNILNTYDESLQYFEEGRNHLFMTTYQLQVSRSMGARVYAQYRVGPHHRTNYGVTLFRRTSNYTVGLVDYSQIYTLGSLLFRRQVDIYLGLNWNFSQSRKDLGLISQVTAGVRLRFIKRPKPEQDEEKENEENTDSNG